MRLSKDFAPPLPNEQFQISTDGFVPYISAITTTISDRCDFAQLIKVYVSNPAGERRYSPAEVTSVPVPPTAPENRSSADNRPPRFFVYEMPAEPREQYGNIGEAKTA